MPVAPAQPGPEEPAPSVQGLLSQGHPGEWFYAVRSKPQGPLAVDTLRAMLDAGQLPRTTPVWRQGMTGWDPASCIAELGGTPQSQYPSSDPVAIILPYRNGLALSGYYCGVFSLIPGIGLLLGPTAIVLGALGLRAARRNPQAKGKLHAIIAVVLGSVVTLGHVVFLVLVAASALKN